MLAKLGNSFFQHPICQYSSTTYPKDRRHFIFHSIIRFVVVLFGCAWALAYPPAPAAAAPAGTVQTAKPAALEIWSGPRIRPFVLDDLHGSQRDLQAFAGKVVLVHFFATWCEPCVREMASLQRLAASSRGKPLAILAIDVAEVDLRVRAFFAKHPVDFTVLLDRDRAVSKSWDVTALPTTFVLDATLAPRLFVEGDLDWSRAGIAAVIESLYPAADPKQANSISSE